MTTQPAHKCSFPVQPPKGSWFNPGPCECGKTYARSMAETLLGEATAAMNVAEHAEHAEHELAAATRQAQDLSALVEELEAKRDQLAARVRELEAQLRQSSTFVAETTRTNGQHLTRIGELEAKLGIAVRALETISVDTEEQVAGGIADQALKALGVNDEDDE